MHFEKGKGVFFGVLPSMTRAVGGAKCGLTGKTFSAPLPYLQLMHFIHLAERILLLLEYKHGKQ
jgi:hypothetical protein